MGACFLNAQPEQLDITATSDGWEEGTMPTVLHRLGDRSWGSGPAREEQEAQGLALNCCGFRC